MSAKCHKWAVYRKRINNLTGKISVEIISRHKTQVVAKEILKSHIPFYQGTVMYVDRLRHA